MRLPSSASSLSLLAVLAASASNAGFLDKLTGASSNKIASNVDAAAPPAPPAEPSLDAFGGSAPGHLDHQQKYPGAPDTIEIGGPSVAAGQPAVKTADAKTGYSGGAGDDLDKNTTPVEPPYEGKEYRWKMFRFRPAEMVTEGILLAGVLVFVAISLGGRKINESQAIAWNKAHIGVLSEQFASYTAIPNTVSLTRVDPSTYVGFASGRRGTSGFAVKVQTYPRNDIFSLIYDAGYKLYDLTYASSYNTVTLDFELGGPTAPSATSTALATPGGSNKSSSSQSNKEDYVWALVKKHVMQQTKEERFDLQAFTSVSEPQALTAAAGNDEWVTFSEANLLNEFFLKKANVGIVELLSQEKQAAKYLRSLIISDIVKERPDEVMLEKEGAIPKSRRLTIVLDLPPSSKAAETVPILELAVNLVDVVSGSSMPNEFGKKAAKRRADVYALLLSESRKEAKDKATASARAIKLKAEQDKLERMTPSERRKYELKQKDKEMRNMAKKQQKR